MNHLPPGPKNHVSCISIFFKKLQFNVHQQCQWHLVVNLKKCVNVSFYSRFVLDTLDSRNSWLWWRITACGVSHRLQGKTIFKKPQKLKSRDIVPLWGWDLAEWLNRLTANAVVATVLCSIPASSDTVESEGRQMKQCWISYTIKRKNPKNPPPPPLSAQLRGICGALHGSCLKTVCAKFPR